ncbi:YbaN family protein [Kushneria phyllosphaerae]|uniref:Inner membrane protein n=1 Tax=Kushneria phyllosphaerae TaxID=2100822 RepID=A0A2R8CKH2_9GAMM|nr:YbaN family protein [Kushneria phyllosphaerae]SPJ33343.1 Inner membrane protein YbaN [Kushneria phyllosphaerae]
MRYFWIGLAGICFALGAAGVIVPLLPTTPFMLAAVALASKGSPRFARWIRQHRLAGPAIKNWEHERAISPRAKGLAVVTLVFSALVIWITIPSLVVRIGVTLLLAGIGSWLVTRATPSQRRKP